MSDIQTFREETQDWLKKNCPPEMRKSGDVCWGGRNPSFSHPDQEIWLEKMVPPTMNLKLPSLKLSLKINPSRYKNY